MVSAFEGCQAYNQSQNPFTPADLVRPVRAFIDFLLFSSIFMGMQGMGMVYTSCVIQGLEPTPAVLAIMLLVPFSVYNMNRKTDEEEDSVNHPGRYMFTKRFEKPLAYGALVTYALAVLIAVPYGVGGVLVTLVPLIAGVLYSMPILPKAFGYRRLKEIPVMKNLVVGGSWTVILVLLPCVASGTPLTIASYLCFAFFFSYVFIASAMPDMRDREGDALTGVRTIPVLIGVDRTKRVLDILNGSTALLVIAVGIGAMLPSLITALIAGTHCYTQYCITSFGRIGRPDMICDILLDGGFVIIGGAIVVAQILVPTMF
jgi:4-hydroxybenzoate polyprenyltransferase